ncbi:MAG: penicillin-binding transpeptidase domain-containing protein [Vicinamibacterales bacterium]
MDTTTDHTGPVDAAIIASATHRECAPDAWIPRRTALLPTLPSHRAVIAGGLCLLACATWLGARPVADARGGDEATCVVLAPLDDPSAAFVSDAAECGRPTAPASTFKVPHALIALEVGVVSATEEVPWDGVDRGVAAWNRSHTLESAIRWSAVWFFQRTAGLIGPDRMRAALRSLHYAGDTFDGDIRQFWLNGDLVVTPLEQLDFLGRMMRGELPVAARHLEAVKAAMVMPAGQVTMAGGAQPFVLDWPEPLVVRAKTGNTTVDGERVSWLIGEFESGARAYVFASRVRSRAPLPSSAGADLAARVLNVQRR